MRPALEPVGVMPTGVGSTHGAHAAPRWVATRTALMPPTVEASPGVQLPGPDWSTSAGRRPPVYGFSVHGLLLGAGRRRPAWRGWATVTLLASLATLVLVALTFSTFPFHEFTSGPAPVGQYGGVMERVLFIEILAWYAAVGWRLFRPSSHTEPKGAAMEGRAS